MSGNLVLNLLGYLGSPPSGLPFPVTPHRPGPLLASLCRLSWVPLQHVSWDPRQREQELPGLLTSLNIAQHHITSGPPKGTASFLWYCAGQRKLQASPDSGRETSVPSLLMQGEKELLVAISGDYCMPCSSHHRVLSILPKTTMCIFKVNWLLLMTLACVQSLPLSCSSPWILELISVLPVLPLCLMVQFMAT